MSQIDAIDERILTELQANGRLTMKALAERVGLSSPAMIERVRRLEERGIIAGYRAEIALKEITPHVTVFVTVELEHHRHEHFAAFEQAVKQHDVIVAAWALGGGFDYLLQVVTHDIDSYQRLIDTLLEAGLGLKRYYTYIVTKAVKDAPPPFGVLLDAD